MLKVNYVIVNGESNKVPGLLIPTAIHHGNL